MIDLANEYVAAGVHTLDTMSAPRALVLLRRPLLTLFVIGCTVSMFASGRMTARLIADGALSFAFIPAAEILAFAIVHRLRRQAWPSAGTFDGYLRGDRPWLWWLLAIIVAAMFMAPARRGDIGPLLLTMPAPIALAGIADWRFLHRQLDETRRCATWDLIWVRLITWSVVALYFFGPGSSPRTFSYLIVELFELLGEWLGGWQ